MGKASKWFRGLLGLKKNDHPQSSSSSTTTPCNQNPKPIKKKWSFVKSYREKEKEKDSNFAKTTEKEPSRYGGGDGVVCGGGDPAKRAIAVAEATAVVAEAAIAAAQAAAAVVKLTGSGRATTTTTSGGVTAWNGVSVSSSTAVTRGNGVAYRHLEDWAAVIIQSHFRAYLSRRALRALKGLVKLQALVRGHIVRQQTADYLRQMQAIARAQSRARAGRSQVSGSPHSSSSKSVQFLHNSPTTPEKFEHIIVRARSLKHDEMLMHKRNTSNSNWKVIDPEKTRIRLQGSSARSSSIDDEKSAKIVEIDTGKPYATPKQRNLFHSSHHSLNSDQYSYSLTTSKESTAHQTVPSPSSCGNQPVSPLKFNEEDLDDTCFCTADNSPQFYSASSKGGSSKRGPFTPTKSDGSRSCLSGYSDHPSYMSYTESAKAKVRSLSAPKQRPHYERSSSTKRYSIHGYSESRNNSQKSSFYAGKAYPGSGRLDRLGMPVIRADPSGFSGGLRHRY